jgi:hypothetical protein
MLEFYDRTVLLFATQILRQKTDKMRANVIIHLFSVWAQHKNLIYISEDEINKLRNTSSSSLWGNSLNYAIEAENISSWTMDTRTLSD